MIEVMKMCVRGGDDLVFRIDEKEEMIIENEEKREKEEMIIENEEKREKEEMMRVGVSRRSSVEIDLCYHC